MKHSDYPALFMSASDLSAEAQTSFFRAFKWHIGLLIAAAIISMVNSTDALVAIVQAMTLLCALGCAVYLFSSKPDRHWYSGRALAESVKTSTWRFITKSEPFANSDEQDRHSFVQRLKQLLELNKDLAGRLSTHLDESQVTDEMERVRQLPTADRQAYYRDHRIVEQLSWYAQKAAFNRRKATGFYIALFVTIFVAVIFSLAKIRFPALSYWPTDTLVTIAASLLSWIQAKRFQELAVSYALTAHEIGFIRQQSGGVMSDDQLSAFVGDSENAFSREHTQWTARRDT